eukprot:TRINITY_DN1829_c0_g1_i1.p1 TRINITY_DN1829_c0_g1~~TRINITY_DN1829_c0_g1_i1.p1  ORF type:complete len:225 (-),score=39.64 TRINITY_DN1829_c0_g1_i1:162-836(-)
MERLSFYFLLVSCLFLSVHGHCGMFDFMNCTIIAAAKLNKSIPGLPDDINEVICENIQEQVNCIESIDLTCLSLDKKTVHGFSAAQESLKPMENGKVREICNSDPNFPRNFMLGATGSNDCSFLDYTVFALPEFHSCLLHSFNVWLLNELPSRKVGSKFNLEKLACKAFEDIVLTCQSESSFLDCFSPPKREAFMASQDAIFKRVVEYNMQKNLNPSFKFPEKC